MFSYFAIYWSLKTLFRSYSHSDYRKIVHLKQFKVKIKMLCVFLSKVFIQVVFAFNFKFAANTSFTNKMPMLGNSICSISAINIKHSSHILSCKSPWNVKRFLQPSHDSTYPFSAVIPSYLSADSLVMFFFFFMSIYIFAQVLCITIGIVNFYMFFLKDCFILNDFHRAFMSCIQLLVAGFPLQI